MASFSNESSKKPNLLVTGTPGVGKTSTAQLIAERLPGFTCIEVGAIVKENNLGDYDKEFDTMVYDDDHEEKLLDILEPMCNEGGKVVDFHTPELFPESWFELVLVLRADTNVLYDRLEARGYNEKKRTENMECEIMQVVLEEARDSYAVEMVHEVPSNTLDDMESNVSRVEAWYQSWKQAKVSS